MDLFMTPTDICKSGEAAAYRWGFRLDSAKMGAQGSSHACKYTSDNSSVDVMFANEEKLFTV